MSELYMEVAGHRWDSDEESAYIDSKMCRIRVIDGFDCIEVRLYDHTGDFILSVGEFESGFAAMTFGSKLRSRIDSKFREALGMVYNAFVSEQEAD